MTAEDEPDHEREDQDPPKDLRAELMANLSTTFAARLEAANGISKAAQEALVELIKHDVSTSATVTAALSKRDELMGNDGCEGDE